MMHIPNYELKEIIGQGGMAIVYRAEHTLLKQDRAIKLMSANQSREASFEASFLREGQLIASLRHPHIITVYDVGLANEGYFLVMEYLADGSLKEKLAQGSISLSQALSVFEQVGSALDYAHQLGLIHRDIKPANILFRDAQDAVLTDFGISKLQDTETDLTRHGYSLMGTPRYMSPEQASSQPLDIRSDIYSLALVLYEMLVGKPAIQADNTVMIIREHALAPAPVLPLPYAYLQPVLEKALAKTPEQRYSSVREFVEAIQQASQLNTVETTVIQLMPSNKPPLAIHSITNNKKWWYALAGFLLILLVTVVIAWNWSKSSSELFKATSLAAAEKINQLLGLSKTPMPKSDTSAGASQIQPPVSTPEPSQPIIYSEPPKNIEEPIKTTEAPAIIVSGGSATTLEKIVPTTDPIVGEGPVETSKGSKDSTLAGGQNAQVLVLSTSKPAEAASSANIKEISKSYRLMRAAKQPYISLYASTVAPGKVLTTIPINAELKVFDPVLIVDRIEWFQADFGGQVGYVKSSQLKPK